MKIKVLDQIHISAVKTDSLRPGDVFEVDDAAGADMLKRNPKVLERVDAPLPQPAEKAEPAPKNKATRPAKNKAASA